MVALGIVSLIICHLAGNSSAKLNSEWSHYNNGNFNKDYLLNELMTPIKNHF